MRYHMLFSSITFLVFFLPSVLILYFAVPNLTYRNTILFFASLLFYAWGEPKFVFLMLATIVVNYCFGILLSHGGKHNKIALIFAILFNLSILFLFKYLNFSIVIIDSFLSALHMKPISTINKIMPIGISFYTFQEITYLVDVYKKPQLVQRNPLNLGLYISFFPQLIAGPIVRYHTIKEQIEKRVTSISQFSNGVERFIIGLSKKVLIANSMGYICDTVYSADFYSYGTYAAWIAAIAYMLQIYYDFSGYSDMAIGLAKLFGFNLSENFNYPYAASSITDFWKRWHISLTNFFRDYVYIPLGGNRKGKIRTIINRYIVFFTTGLWHGADYNFIIWGLAHGTIMSVERIFDRKAYKNRFLHYISILIKHSFTLLLILFLWVLFRNDIKDAVKIILKMLGFNYSIFSSHFTQIVQDEFLLLYFDTYFYFLALIGIAFAFPWWKKITILYNENKYYFVLSLSKYIILICLFILCYANLADNSYNPFIYFRF